MRSYPIALMLATALAAAGLETANAAGGPARLPCPMPVMTDRCPAWIDLYDHPGGHGNGLGADLALGAAVSPDGRRVYVGGYSQDDSEGLDGLILAYDPGTGDRVWAYRYAGPTGAGDVVLKLAPSLDGERVYAVGTRDGETGGGDFLVLALDAESGERLWVSSYDNGGSDFGLGLAVGPSTARDDRPGADRLYVVGQSEQAANDTDGAVAALDGPTGEILWTARYADASGFLPYDALYAAAVDPAGERVVVVGETFNEQTSTFDAVALALETGIRDGEEDRAGVEAWRARRPASAAYLVNFAPDGDRLFWSGLERRSGGMTLGLPPTDYLTVALGPGGEDLWAAQWSGFGVNGGENFTTGMALSPGGDRVYVTGVASGLAEGDDDYGTIARDAESGELLWVSRYGAPGHVGDGALGIGVSADGGHVFVTGVSGATPTRTLLFSNAFTFFFLTPEPIQADVATLALESDTGVPAWTARHNGSEEGEESSYASSLAVAGGDVLVTGWTQRRVDRSDEDPLDGRNRVDLLTAAFEAG